MFGENLYSCFSAPRRRPLSAPLPASPDEAISSSSATSATSSGFLNHFNSLFDPASDDSETLTPSAAGPAGSSFSSSHVAHDDAGSCPSERDLSTAIATRRLLPASPGRSNSIVEAAAVDVGTAGSGVAVHTYSPDPYWDFRRSMEEMMAALGLDEDEDDDDASARRAAHLHELLVCYLVLNRKHAHKYILSAFTDLVLALASTADVDRSGA